MASTPVVPNTAVSSTDKLKQILKTLTDTATFIEQILAATGIGGPNADEIERLTTAFSSLAALAIQAAHDVAGKEITPTSVLELLPAGTSLTAPTNAQTS